MIFRIRGPTHARNLIDLSINSRCTNYGGCNMFHCNEYDHSYDDDDYDVSEENSDGTEWFTGECMVCSKIIPKPIYAVRIPMPNGGWLGCFCTWGHAADYYATFENAKEQLSIVIGFSKMFEKQLEEHGIQDREYYQGSTTKKLDLSVLDR